MLSPSNLSFTDIFRSKTIWVKLLVVFGVLGISAVVALKFSESYMMLVILALIGIIAALIFIRWPAAGILVATLSGLLIPYSGPSGFNASLLIIAFLLGLWIVELLLDRGRLNIVPSRSLWLSLAFIGTAVLSLAVGQLNWFSFGQHAPFGAQAGGAAIYILSIGAFLLAANRIGSVRWLEGITWIFLGVSAIIVVMRVMISEFTINLDFISSTIFSSPGAVFWIWAAGLAFGQAVFNRKLHPLLRFALIVMTLLIVFHLYVQRYQNKSGWVSVFICLAGVIGSRSVKTSVIICILVVLGVLSFNLVSNVLSSEDYSYSTRLEAGELLVQMLKANPILGVGFGNSYWYATLFPIRGWEVSFSSHNNFIDIALQTGLLGLAIFSLFLAEVAFLMLGLRKRVPIGSFSEGFLHGAMGAFTGMVVAGLLADWILPFFYNIGMHGFRHSVIGWLFLGGVLVLANTYKTERQASSATEG